VGGLSLRSALSVSNHFPSMCPAVVGNLELRSALSFCLRDQSFLCLLRSKPLHSARRYSQWALSLAQSCGDSATALSLMEWNASLALMGGSRCKSKKLWQARCALSYTVESQSLFLFHSAIQNLSISNFEAALADIRSINRTKSDTCLLGSCAKNFEMWILLMTGQVEACLKVLDKSLKGGRADRAELEELWSCHIRIVIAILSGSYSIAHSCLRRMDALQHGRRGKLYHTSLQCVVSVAEKQHLSEDKSIAQLCVSNLASCARALAATSPCTPIALVTTFLVAYSSATVLERDDSFQSGVSSGHGQLHRLLTSVWSLRDVLNKMAAESFPCLQNLVESLDMKMIRILQTHSDSYRHPETESTISVILSNARPALAFDASEPASQPQFGEFSFGQLFRCIEYCKSSLSQGKTPQVRCDTLRTSLLTSFTVPVTHCLLS
jgi:hypothetical protein